jgi:hypothetical protein
MKHSQFLRRPSFVMTVLSVLCLLFVVSAEAEASRSGSSAGGAGGGGGGDRPDAGSASGHLWRAKLDGAHIRVYQPPRARPGQSFERKLGCIDGQMEIFLDHDWSAESVRPVLYRCNESPDGRSGMFFPIYETTPLEAQKHPTCREGLRVVIVAFGPNGRLSEPIRQVCRNGVFTRDLPASDRDPADPLRR